MKSAVSHSFVPSPAPRLCEALEARSLLAVGVFFSDSDRDGFQETMKVIGNNNAQVVVIEDDAQHHIMRISVDLNGDGAFTGPGEYSAVERGALRRITLDLGGGNDRVTFTRFVSEGEAGAVALDARRLDVKLGAGNDEFTLDVLPTLDFSTYTKALRVDISMGTGDDAAAFRFEAVGQARELAVSADLGAGSNALDLQYNSSVFDNGAGFAAGVVVKGGTGNDIVTARNLQGSGASWDFTTPPRNAIVLDFKLGNGNNVVTIDGEDSLGEASVTSSVMTLGVKTGSGDDTINIRVPRVASFGVWSATQQGYGAGFAGVVRAGGGDDQVSVALPEAQVVGSLENDAVNPDGRPAATSIELYGEGGGDVLRVERPSVGGANEADIDGEVLIRLRGGAGDDELTLDLGALSVNSTGTGGPDEPTTAARVWVLMDGESGRDRLNFLSAITPLTGVSAPDYALRGVELKMLGGGGNDTFNVRVTAPSRVDEPTFYAVPYALLVDGGSGVDGFTPGFFLPDSSFVVRIEAL